MKRTDFAICFLGSLMMGLFPLITWASCQSIVTQINDDINHYDTHLPDQRLPWMQLHWLQEKLGDSERQTLANQDIQYQWQCNNGSGLLTAQTDAQGNINTISGEYNSNEGSGRFSTPIHLSSTEKSFNQSIAKIDAAPISRLLSTPQTPTPTTETAPEENSCQTTIAQIHSNLANTDWMNTTWLQQRLGKAKVSTSYNYIYTWNHFSLYAGVDGSFALMGTPPRGAPIKSAQDALERLGTPKKSISEKLLQLAWTCSEADSSNLTVFTQENGQFTTVMGRDCSTEGCNPFFTSVGESPLANKFKQQAKEDEQLKAQALVIKLKDYNQYFKINLLNQDQLDANIELKIKEFYEHLRTCTPGVYQYVTPVWYDFIFNTSSIHKKETDVCHVETSYTIPQIGKVVLKCNYQPQDLSLFTDQEAEASAQGHSTFDSQNPSALQKMMDGACTRYIDGVR